MSLCSGDCDEDRGQCYCAGLAPRQRPLPHNCQPAVHLSTKLPDGRPAIPALSSDGEWEMAKLYFEQLRNENHGWFGTERIPFEGLYGRVTGNPTSPKLRAYVYAGGEPNVSPFCNVTAAALPYHRTVPWRDITVRLDASLLRRSAAEIGAAILALDRGELEAKRRRLEAGSIKTR